MRGLVVLPMFALLTLAPAGARQPPQTVQRPGETVGRPPLPARPDDTEGTAVIRGHVTSPDGRPLSQARVTVTEASTRKSRAETTDADGRYEFSGLIADTYAIAGSKTGYATLEFGQRRGADPGKRVKLAAGETIERIDFVLPRAGVVVGRVVDEHADPIEGASIAAMRVDLVDGRRRLVPNGKGRVTNDLGRFRLFDLQPGRYVLSASPATEGPHRLPGYAPAYYPGTSSLADAQLITLGGEDFTGVEMQLAPGRAAKVSGVAMDSRGQPHRGLLLLSVSQRSGALATAPARTTVHPDGAFEFLNVAPGDYVLQAIERGALGGEFSTQFVAAGDADVGGLTVRTAAGSTVSGRITLEGGAARMKPQDFQFMFVQADFDLAPMQGTYRAKINDDWTFEMVGLFGPLYIRPIGRPGWLVKSIHANATDITDTAVAFGRKEDSLADVEVVLTMRGAEVTGTVTDARGQPVTDYAAVVFPSDRTRWYQASRFLKAARSDPDGTFTAMGLPAGEYLVSAVTRIQGAAGSEDWQDPAFLESLAPSATRLTLAEGQRATITLRALASVP